MKTQLTTALFLFALIVFSTITAAQITITSADASAINAVGNVITNHFDSTTTFVDIGSPGATSWDFSSLNSHTSNSFTSVVPSSTPYYLSDFSTSNVVFTFTETIDGTVADGWQYSTQNPGDYLMNGVVSESVIDVDTLLIKAVYNPAQINMPLPFTYNSQWGGNFVISSTTYFNGFPFGTNNFNHTESVLVDAYGPMTMPGGSVLQALRVRKDDSYTFAGGSHDRTISYSFITKNGTAVEVVASDTNALNSGIIQSLDGVTWSSTGITAVENENQIPTEFSLSQNYPNPFNPSTSIKYQVSKSSQVLLKVYDLLGREVAELVNEEKPVGTYEVTFDASELSSGVYYYQIKAENYLETKKMVLLR
jgi:hypothetical protein